MSEKGLSSTIGPAEDSTCLRVTSYGTESVNTTVVSSLALTSVMLASSDDGPFSSLIFLTRSEGELHIGGGQVMAVSNFRPDFSLTVNSVPSEFQVPSSAAISRSARKCCSPVRTGTGIPESARRRSRCRRSLPDQGW